MEAKLFGFINLQSKTNTIFWTTVIVSILDALAAIVVYGIFFQYNPVQIYQFVSSAILGNDAYSGGIPIALLGVFFHTLIAFFSSILFFQLYPHISIIRGNSTIVGLLYGLMVWLVMNMIVLPLTKIPAAPFDMVSVLAIAWHMVLVGWPISFIVSKYYLINHKSE